MPNIRLQEDNIDPNLIIATLRDRILELELNLGNLIRATEGMDDVMDQQSITIANLTRRVGDLGEEKKRLEKEIETLRSV